MVEIVEDKKKIVEKEPTPEEQLKEMSDKVEVKEKKIDEEISKEADKIGRAHV